MDKEEPPGGEDSSKNRVTSPSPLPSSASSSSITGPRRRRESSTSRTSQPTSPTREKPRAGFLGKVTSLSQAVTARASEAREKAEQIRTGASGKVLTLLVIDDQDTDWAKYFRGKRIEDADIRVEQVEWRELTLCASSADRAVACVRRSSRTPFRPDFLLVRQNLRDAGEDYRHLLLGLQYGGVPSVNSLQSVYNFQDKPWVYAHLADIQRKLGREAFPLIEQHYYPDHRDMVPVPMLPCVLKVGHAHGGLGKVKVESETNYKDLASVVAVSGQYCTVEQYVEAKYDLHIYKLGSHYRALIASHCCDCRRKSLGGNWKTDTGLSVLEEVEVQDRYKRWIDAVSEMFGGLVICSLEAVVAKDGTEVIIEVNDCALALMGDSQEEDRKRIAELTFAHMEESCTLLQVEANGHTEDGKENGVAAEGRQVVEKTGEAGLLEMVKLPPGPVQRGPQERVRNASQVSSGSSESSGSTGSGDTVLKAGEDREKQELGAGESEDTMTNLRSSFAGIFGTK